MGRIPERTCIGCRRVGPVHGLIRLAAPDGQVKVAARRGGRAMSRQGRGAWLHPRAECVTAAVTGRVFARAFRGALGPQDLTQLLADVRAASGASFHEMGDSP